MTTKRLNLDVWQTKNICVKANQGEVNSRFLEISLTENGAVLDLMGKSVIFYATKPDGNLIFNSCEIENAENGTVTVCLTSQMSAKPGIMPCEVHIIANDKATLKAVGLELEIVKCADLEDAVESRSEFTALEKAMAEYEGASEKFNFHLDSKNNPHEVTTEQIGAVPATRTINSKALNSDIELNCDDIGAAEENHAHDFSELANTPTTLAGYGITDASVCGHTHDFNSITEKPTTLAGYGIADASVCGHTHDFNSITEKPTTLAGYGIIDAATAQQGMTADSALQGVKIDGNLLVPDEEKIVNIEISASQTYTATIGVTWQGNSAPYTQTITVDGLTNADTPVVDVFLNADKETALSQLEAWNYISKIETNDGSITVTCLEDKPTVEIPIQLKVVR